MMSRFVKDAEHIYVAPGFTDFRKQSTSLAALVSMKFQWPMKAEEVRLITPQQMEWLLEGLSIEQKKAHHEVTRSLKNSCY